MPVPIPSYDDWMKHTALGITQPRSLALRAVDTALKDYWADHSPPVRRKKVSALRLALNEWIRQKGNWKQSERNKPPRRIVAELHEGVNAQPAFTPEEIQAFQWQDEQRRKRIAAIFRRKQIVWQAFNAPAEARQAHAAVVRCVAKGPGQIPEPDVEAIKKHKEMQAAQVADRRACQSGKGSALRSGFNPLASAGLGIESLQRGGVGAKAAEHSFGLAGAGDSRGAFLKMIGDLYGGAHSLGDISMHLMHTVGMDAHELAASVTPVISNITSGAKLLMAWGKVALAKYREYDACQHAHVLMPGEMEAAFQALHELLDRKVTSETVQASIQTADFTARTALSFVDFGAVSGAMVGVVSTLGKFVHKLYLLGREHAETRAANRLLSNPDHLDYQLFGVYPLLGCYMLVCSDLSEIIALSRVESVERGVPFGAEGWMDDVEYLKRNHIDPLLERASSLIYSSPFMIPGMPMHALYKPGSVDSAGQKASKGMFLGNMARVGARVATGLT